MNQVQNQNCEGFTSTSLMGNWREDREAIIQPFSTNRDYRNARELENESIAFPTIRGQMKPLQRIPRTYPWQTKDIIIVDDNFREFKSQTQVNHDINNLINYQQIQSINTNIKCNGQKIQFTDLSPFSQIIQQQNKKTMLIPSNYSQVSQNERYVPQKATDYGSVLKKHNNENGRLYDLTTFQESYSRIKQRPINNIINQTELPPAGTFDKDYIKEGKKINSILVGELFNEQSDPKYNLMIQRTWAYNKDQGLQQAKQSLQKSQSIANELNISNPLQTFKKSISQVFDFDINTSLKMPKEYKKIQYGDYLQRHIRSDITLVQNKFNGKK